ncbi:Disintegrin and metalloproteinase domain-containing protein 28 [Varanus komodoensis]|nr:Disintegrin and metalloproteinase domain-containing protein 28 [Varanus komodoensis]
MKSNLLRIRVEELTSARYLEYYAVVDRSKFIAEKRNETDLVILVLQMMANVHAMFLGIGLRIYLVGLELWTQRDHITISPDSLNTTLVDFYSYVTRELRHRVRFDHAGLIT